MVDIDFVELSSHMRTEIGCNLDAMRGHDLVSLGSKLFAFLCIFLTLPFILFTGVSSSS